MKQAETEVVVGDERMRDRKGRRQLTEARWAELLSEYEGSGLTQAEFARRGGLVYTTLAHRVQRRRRMDLQGRRLEGNHQRTPRGPRANAAGRPSKVAPRRA